MLLTIKIVHLKSPRRSVYTLHANTWCRSSPPCRLTDSYAICTYISLTRCTFPGQSYMFLASQMYISLARCIFPLPVHDSHNQPLIVTLIRDSTVALGMELCCFSLRLHKPIPLLVTILLLIGKPWRILYFPHHGRCTFS